MKYIDADELKEEFEKEYRSKYKDYIDGRNSMFDVAKILLAETLTTEIVEHICEVNQNEIHRSR